MLSFQEGEKLMKEMNTTPEELDMMWDVCLKVGHRLISQFAHSGIGWRELNPAAIKTLPREYQKIINSNANIQNKI